MSNVNYFRATKIPREFRIFFVHIFSKPTKKSFFYFIKAYSIQSIAIESNYSIYCFFQTIIILNWKLDCNGTQVQKYQWNGLWYAS
jgi:hypothetical protein